MTAGGGGGGGRTWLLLVVTGVDGCGATASTVGTGGGPDVGLLFGATPWSLDWVGSRRDDERVFMVGLLLLVTTMMMDAVMIRMLTTKNYELQIPMMKKIDTTVMMIHFK